MFLDKALIFLVLFSFPIHAAELIKSQPHLNSSSLNDMRIETVLDFWFDYAHHPESLFERKLWWEKNPTFDDTIRQQFSSLREDAIAGKLNSWLETPRGSLAYIILIDQFSRNLFRNTPQMYEHDDLALQAASGAVKQGFDQQLSLSERIFLYLPFEHAENLQSQQQSIKLFEQLAEEASAKVKPLAKKHLKYAKDHYDVIEKFNRFPHRNAILGRTSTEAEKQFLETHKGW